MPRDSLPDSRAASRLGHAIRLWQRYLEPERLPQLDRWLAQELKQQRQYGKRDRALYSEALFAAMRFGYLATFLDFARGRLDPAARGGLEPALLESLEAFARVFSEPSAALMALRRLPPATLFHGVGLRYGAEPATGPWPLAGAGEVAGRGQLERLFQAFAGLRERNMVTRLLWAGVPLSFAPALERRRDASAWDDEALAAFLAAQGSRPPLWLRLNHFECRDTVVEELLAQGFQVEPHGEALRVEGSRSLYELRAFEQGQIEIQDWASQRIGAACAAQPGELVWDACAGGGGKTLQLASRLRNRGAVYASDIREYKLKEVRRRAARGHFDNVRTFVWQGEPLASLPVEAARRGGFQWVLVDAPCSSSGTWRRNPDARFRAEAQAVAELQALQLRLLGSAAHAVAPGGHLVYSTCSWLVEEDESVVEAFLAAQPGFRLERQELQGCPGMDADTMFCAVLARVE